MDSSSQKTQTIYRVEKNRQNPYVMMCKHHVFDSSLSLQAQGLLTHFLCRPDDWQFHEKEILKHFTNQRDSFRRARQELIDAGYIEVQQRRSDLGQFRSTQYKVYEFPFNKFSPETIDNEQILPLTGFPSTAEATSANRPLLKKDVTKERMEEDTHQNRQAIPVSESTPLDSSKNIPYETMVEMYNRMAKQCGIPRLLKILPKHKSLLKARFVDLEKSLDNWGMFLEKISKTPFLLGNSSSGWKPKLSWMLNEEKFFDILAGAYDSHQLNKPSAREQLMNEARELDRSNAFEGGRQDVF